MALQLFLTAVSLIVAIAEVYATVRQHRQAQESLRNQDQAEQFAEVRRYLEACVRLADLLMEYRHETRGRLPAARRWRQEDVGEWKKRASEHVRMLKNLPVATSARTVIVRNNEVLERLEQVDKQCGSWLSCYDSVMMHGHFVTFHERGGAEGKRDELVGLAGSLSRRLDELLGLS